MTISLTDAHTKSSLDAFLKDVYGDKLESLIPDFSILTKKIPFSPAKKTGRDFVQPVKLSNEHSFSYGSGLQSLSDIISSEGDDAKVRGSSMTLRAAFSYDAAANMISSKGAFIDATKYKFMAMMESATHRLEAQILYGNCGLGIADSSQDSVTAVAAGDNGNNYAVIPITAASWAAGIWAGSENAHVSFILASDNSTASAAAGLGNVVNKFQIKAVDNVNKTITVKCYDASASAALVVEVEAADYNVYWYGSNGNEMVGLRTIISNTGTLFGINGATYSLWQGNTYGVGSANLTLKRIYQGINMAVGKGLMEDVVVLVSPATFSTIAGDEATLRRYNATSSTAENGFENVKFYGPNGKIEIIVHPMIREQEAMAFPIKKVSRIGASDLSFKTPGRDDEMFQHLAEYAGYECRLYSEQAIFCTCPCKCVLFTGVSNSIS